jgi:hypothetical protein
MTPREYKALLKRITFLEQHITLQWAELEKNELNLIEEWLDSADMKQQFHLSDSTLARLRKNKTIPFDKLGGRYIYPKRLINQIFLERIYQKYDHSKDFDDKA